MKTSVIAIFLLCAVAMQAQRTELLPFGDMNNWVTRNIKESHVIGGKYKKCYEIAPHATIEGDKPYRNRGGSPWATSNVMAKVAGITKVSNAVFPDVRDGHDLCAKLTTGMENCKALGIIDIDVMVAGTIFLGKMLEPIKSTSNPYSKMEMGMPFARRPKALQFDYKLMIPDGDMVYSSGFGSKKTIPGRDRAEVFIYLQRRWEDENGNIYAKRVGTGREHLAGKTAGWVNGHKLAVTYGDASKTPGFTKRMDLIPKDKSYYARNSKGKMVPVQEVGWDSADAVPTHLMVMFSSGSGDPYVGTEGATFWVDNVALVY